MQIILTIPQLKPLTQKLNQFPVIAAPKIQQAIELSIVSILGKEKDEANTPVRTGHLKNDWTVSFGGLQGFLRSQTPYGGYVQFGTKYQKSNPFLSRAISLSERERIQFFTTAMNAILREISTP